jgi:phage-related minor tail protein
LGANLALDKQGVVQQTRGPMEDFLASLPTTAAKANEALQRLEVQGFDGLIDSVLALSDGVHSATDSLLATLKNFLLGMARLELQKGLGSLLQSSGGLSGIFSSIFGGGSGLGKSLFPVVNGVDPLAPFASGGFTGNISPNKFAGFVHGREGVLNTRGLSMLGVPNLNALNRGVPMSALVNDNSPGHSTRGDTYMTVITPDADSFRKSERQLTRAWQRKVNR